MRSLSISLLSLFLVLGSVNVAAATEMGEAETPNSKPKKAQNADKYTDNSYCDYYDAHGNFMLSFPNGVELGPSGPSSSSGIHFFFKDDSELTIYASTALYDPLYAEPGDLSFKPDDIRLMEEFYKEGCTVKDFSLPSYTKAYASYMQNPSVPTVDRPPVSGQYQTEADIPTQNYIGKKLTCPDYEYAILPGCWQNCDVAQFYVYIQFNHKSKDFYSQYMDIVDSMLFFQGENASRADNTVRNTGLHDLPEYLFLHEDYIQPVHYCQEDRIRPALLKIK